MSLRHIFSFRDFQFINEILEGLRKMLPTLAGNTYIICIQKFKL